MINSAASSLDHAEELAEKTLKKGYPDGEGALSNFPGSTGCEKIGNEGDR